MSSPLSRDPLIDILKALACALIIWHHLAFYGPMSDAVMPLFPGLLTWLYDDARMAVQVFLVLGGYLSVAHLAPEGLARFGSAQQQVVRRFTRLVVPYAVALVVAVLAAALVRPWLDHSSVPAEPRLPQLVAHALLLQNIVGEESLSAGAWYVAIDFQLFLMATLLFAGVRAVRSLGDQGGALLGKALVVIGMAASLLVFNRQPALDMWGLYFFGSYGMGMVVYWAVRSPRPGWWLAGLVALVGLALVLDFRARIAVALLTALGLAWALRRPILWPRQVWVTWLQQWGQMSYSVFLVHFPVCLLVNALVHGLWPQAALPNALGMLAAFMLSAVAGRLLYRWVEQPAPTWHQGLRWGQSWSAARRLLRLWSINQARKGRSSMEPGTTQMIR